MLCSVCVTQRGVDHPGGPLPNSSSVYFAPHGGLTGGHPPRRETLKCRPVTLTP